VCCICAKWRELEGRQLFGPLQSRHWPPISISGPPHLQKNFGGLHMHPPYFPLYSYTSTLIAGNYPQSCLENVANPLPIGPLYGKPCPWVVLGFLKPINQIDPGMVFVLYVDFLNVVPVEQNVAEFMFCKPFCLRFYQNLKWKFVFWFYRNQIVF
jgi:hypothetical protein